jgi:oxygen-independent coproporphyrinogen-3 oxidase
VQTVEQTEAVMRRAREKGFAGINVDLIYGLPFQTPDTFEETVEQVIRLGADRAAVYSFAFVPWMRAHMKKLGEEALPDRDTKFSLFAIARERFLAAGYEPIGMDHFARPEDELAVARREGRLRRNFQGYTVIPADDVLGLGISSIGDVKGAYVQNLKKLSTYEQAIREERLPLERGIIRSADDEVRRRIIHDLMCNFTIDTNRIETEFSVAFPSYFEEDLKRLEEYEKEGLVEIGRDRIRATPTGELFVRNLAMCFDRYWREKHESEEKPIFSRTV